MQGNQSVSPQVENIVYAGFTKFQVRYVRVHDLFTTHRVSCYLSSLP